MDEESMKRFGRTPQCVKCGSALVTEEAKCLPCALKPALAGVDASELEDLRRKVEAAGKRYGWIDE
jgi:hypothetical protein